MRRDASSDLALTAAIALLFVAGLLWLDMCHGAETWYGEATADETDH